MFICICIALTHIILSRNITFRIVSWTNANCSCHISNLIIPRVLSIGIRRLDFVIRHIRLIVCLSFTFNMKMHLFRSSGASPCTILHLFISVILSMLNSSKAASISFTIPSGHVALFLFNLICADFTSDFNNFGPSFICVLQVVFSRRGSVLRCIHYTSVHLFLSLTSVSRSSFYASCW